MERGRAIHRVFDRARDEHFDLLGGEPGGFSLNGYLRRDKLGENIQWGLRGDVGTPTEQAQREGNDDAAMP